MNTRGYGGRELNKGITVRTNDAGQPRTMLTVSGRVDKFITIKPRYVRLAGLVGKPIKASIKIIPEPRYPVRILETAAAKGEYIRYSLDEVKGPQGPVYQLTVENTRPTKGRYFDTINLKTDSRIQPEIKISVYGNITNPAAVEKKQTGRHEQE